MSLERQTVAALKWSAASRFAAQAVTWAITLIVIRLLEPADYGLMSIVAVVISIGTYLADFGLAQALVQVPILGEELRARLAGLVITLHLALAALVALAAPLIAAATAQPSLTPLVQVASLQFLFLALGSVQQALALRALDFKRLARIDFGCATLTALVTLSLAWSGLGIWSLVLGNLAGALARAIWLVGSGTWVRPHFSFGGLRERITYGARLAVSQLSWHIVNQSDVMIGARLMTSASLGAYSVGMHLATLPMQKLIGIVNQVGFSALASLQNEPERLRSRLLLAVRLLAIFSVPVLWGISALAPELVEIVLGPKWVIAIRPLQLASLVVPLRMVTAVFSTAVVAVGRSGTDLRNTLVITIVWPTSFAVGAQWEATGLAAAWLVAIPLTFALNFPRIRGVLGVPFAAVARVLAAPIGAGLLMYAAVVALRMALPDTGLWLRALLLVGSGAIVYLVAITSFDRPVWRDLRRVLSSENA